MDDEIIQEQLKKVRDPRILIVGAVAFGIGAGLGYILGKRQRKFIHAVPAQDWSMADLKSVAEDNAPDPVIVKGETFISKKLEEGTDLVVVVKDGQTAVVENEPIIANVFAEDEWDYEAEVAKRTEDEPYVLHRDEFYSDEQGYTQSTLTYYAGDDMLVDEENKPIYNFNVILGPLLFGHGSGDENVFYIRNDKLRAEYEITRDLGLYSVEVLGLEIEDNARTTNLQHSADRKFRQDD